MSVKKDWKINVIFHKYLINEYYTCDPSYRHEYYDFVKCNHKHAAKYDKDFGYNIWEEKNLKFYNSYYQQNTYMAPSLIYHFFKNRLHQQYKFVGFIEYDIALMQKKPDGKMKNGFTKMIDDIVQNNNEMIIPLRCQHTFKTYTSQNFILRKQNVMKTIVDDYNKFFKTSHVFSEIVLKNPLLTGQQSFILDNKTFDRVGRFLEYIFENKLAEGGVAGGERPSTILDRYIATALLLDETKKFKFNYLDHKNHKEW